MGQVPVPAAWLGGLGVVPFAALAAAGPFLDGASRGTVALALIVYGAVILSFLGGIGWGLAIGTATAPAATAALARRLTISICPPLAGWTALLLPHPLALAVLAAAFCAVLMADLRPGARAESPVWYPQLRWPLTLAVVTSLAAALGWAG
jgi:hypothetical protein